MSAKKIGMSVKIDPSLREKLESIADREDRALSNQISYFLKRAIEDYAHGNNLTWFENEKSFYNNLELLKAHKREEDEQLEGEL